MGEVEIECIKDMSSLTFDVSIDRGLTACNWAYAVTHITDEAPDHWIVRLWVPLQRVLLSRPTPFQHAAERGDC